MSVNGAYVKLNVERYGGMILSTWFDRPLSVAGRMIIRKNGKILEKLVNIDRDLVMIPSLAIHMNRDINGGYHYNVQKDMLPLYSGNGEKGNFMRMLAEEAEVRPEDILGHDLFLYNRMPGTIWGSRNEFVSSPRLDDLQCAFASLEGFLQADKKKNITVHCVLDNEEVGSTTKQGAASTFLKDVLFRINLALGGDQETYLMALAESFMISADNAHALHPNYTDKADPVNRPVMNGGIVIKYNANQILYRWDLHSEFQGTLQRSRGAISDICEPFRYCRRIYFGKYFQHSGSYEYGRYRPSSAGHAFRL